MPTTLIRNVRPWGGEPSDVTVAGETIAAVTAHEPGSAVVPAEGTTVVEGRGRLLLPSFSDVHVHLDSTRLGLPFREHTGAPGVWGMMLNDRNNWRHAEACIDERVETTLRMMIERGTTRVRSYAQVDVDCGLERFEAVAAARETHRGRADVQIIAFPQAGLLLEDGSAAMLEEALKAGADVVGGIDPCSLDRDPVRHLDIVFGLAEKYQLPVDIHLHEPGELGHFSASLIAERTRALGMQGLVTISHGYPLWSVSEAHTRSLIETWAELDISTATVAPAGPHQLPLARLAEAGVRVGLGEDGQRDYWSPYGNADMLDRTWQLAFANGFRADELIGHAAAVATMGGAAILDRSLPRLRSAADRPGTQVSDVASFILVPGDSVAAAVMDRPADRTVLHRGRVVADQLALV
ncbi:cytosine/adenosine deaminase-related metal-dependent hydrolase [Arthrobacter stackebrandtii]|uniref:Cytosine/adenosine deaminase-related metal-dependent hydrolase n=1 Tax=Arthrobacter stackebrandtii TaxID=272161 RepID=A0ABS4YTI0_9MICC|nr:amidohydrolase family protein [Arthrobacter stackebrandtii]MBP2412054.1 cytosine/adenosine deaminase-related metal-dependent hydrolase [Arthrobacter stackebrandtii]PYG98835.1 N-isopropylammelide isopropylaminohydrolase [Arthrobacter stackebrandtii]